MPLRTLYHWAREELVAPSVSVTGEKLWSYRDLLMLRLVRWLRMDKPEVARIMTARVRGTLDDLGDDVWWSIGGVATSRRSR